MTGKLLFVDDETATLGLLSRFFRLQGYECDVSDGMEQAIEKLGKGEFHVVVTDKNMPSPISGNEGGIDLIRYIRRNYPSVGIIVMTGYATVESAVEVMRLGAFDYIQKPFLLEELKKKVERVLEYQICLNPESILKTYDSLRAQMLDLYEKSDKETEESKRLFLKLTQDHMDTVFQTVKTLERMLIAQRDRLANVESCAVQLLEDTPPEDPRHSLVERIVEEATLRL